MKAVALVDRQFHEISAPILFKYFRLTIKSVWPKKWEYYNNIPWHYVKVIVVTGAFSVGTVGGWVDFGLLKMIESAKCLQEF